MYYLTRVVCSSRMLKKFTSFVLATLRGLTYRSVRLDYCWLRPCQTYLLSNLQECPICVLRASQ